MLSLKNLTAHPLTTLGGLVVGCLTAGLNGAAAAFAQGGGVTDWKPYAAAAVSAAVPVVIGALLPDPGKASAAAPSSPTGPTGLTSPTPSHKGAPTP